MSASRPASVELFLHRGGGPFEQVGQLVLASGRQLLEPVGDEGTFEGSQFSPEASRYARSTAPFIVNSSSATTVKEARFQPEPVARRNGP
jgi:hypothetical protein